MGLIKAGLGAASSVLADQWKEFFYCDSIPETMLMVRGSKRVTANTSNTKSNDNIISNGSDIAVADGQCMLIVDNGKIVEVCAEPGTFTYNSSTEPSVFAGSLGKSIIDTFKSIGKRFTFGGDTGREQRVYYVNTKFITDNLFGSPVPIPFRVVDSKVGLDIDVSVRCSGRYVYQIENPLLFYTNLASNVIDNYPRAKIDNTLKSEFVTALQPALGKISDMEVRPNQLTRMVGELRDEMNAVLSQQWIDTYGIKIVSISLNPITLPEEDAKILRDAQVEERYTDPARAAAMLATGQRDAMKAAASNSAGAMTGFMGMGMAQQAGGVNAQSLFQMAAQQQPAQAPNAGAPAQAAGGWKCDCGAMNTGNFCNQCGKAKPAPVSGDGWKCACGADNNGKFCVECGKPKPSANTEGWSCSCGAVNGGKFCMECGKAKPAGEPLYRCDKCGWEPADPKNPPKFCPECADPFNDEDIK